MEAVKLNVLDAIHYLSLTKSAVQSSVVLNVQHEGPGQGEFLGN